ncbi:hypothetical protein ACE1OE_08225 [Vibrio sp. E150_011]
MKQQRHSSRLNNVTALGLSVIYGLFTFALLRYVLPNHIGVGSEVGSALIALASEFSLPIALLWFLPHARSTAKNARQAQLS